MNSPRKTSKTYLKGDGSGNIFYERLDATLDECLTAVKQALPVPTQQVADPERVSRRRVIRSYGRACPRRLHQRSYSVPRHRLRNCCSARSSHRPWLGCSIWALALD